MKNRIIALALGLALTVSALFSLSGCAPVARASDLMSGVKANSVSQNTDLDGAGYDAFSDFAVRLFRESSPSGENALISPLSVLCALAMTANGAKGETLAQMEEVFGLSVPEMNSYLGAYLEALPSGDKYKVSAANSIWFDDDEKLSVSPAFLQTNADYYGASIYKTVFDKAAQNAINAWVYEKTDGMIESVLDEIPESAVMYLINALAFDAEWENIYNESQVRDGEFTSASGQKQKAEMMYSDEYAYLEGQGATGFIKYYADRKYAFAALLPDQGVSIDEYTSSLTGGELSDLLQNVRDVKVKTAIPKFESEYSLEMSEIFKAMGMENAFDSSLADFSALGSCEDGNIFIGKILHKTHIAVDERGTKAGAVTAVQMEATSMPLEEPKTVYLDRPFVYMLIDCETMLPLFIGTVVDIDG